MVSSQKLIFTVKVHLNVIVLEIWTCAHFNILVTYNFLKIGAGCIILFNVSFIVGQFSDIFTIVF